VAGHGLVVAVLFVSLRQHPVHVYTLPGTPSGTHVELAYLPGRAPAPVVHPHAKVKPQPAVAPLTPMPHLTVTETTASPSQTSAPAPVPDATTGTDSWGSGSVQIALTTYSPSPTPDLSVLPHGIQGDVVVDVTIDPNGKVADLAVLHTLGYGIESSVIGTLKTWMFHPATKDGTPIASVQELHFHFGPV
jgi:periplasmic protein TonB